MKFSELFKTKYQPTKNGQPGSSRTKSRTEKPHLALSNKMPEETVLQHQTTDCKNNKNFLFVYGKREKKRQNFNQTV